MKSRRHSLVAIAALAGAAWAPAADEPRKKDGGLLESKEALRQLQKEQVLKRNADEAGGNLKDALPRLDTPVPGAPAVSFTPPAERAAADARRGAEKQENWLLEGVERLRREESAREGEARPGRNGRAAAGGAEDKETSERDDARRDNQSRSRAADRESPLLGGAAEPMAGLMKDWLAGSPVDRKVFDSILGKPAGAGTAAGDRQAGKEPEQSLAGGRRGDIAFRPPEGSMQGGTAANPFLQSLEPLRTSPATPAAGIGALPAFPRPASLGAGQVPGGSSPPTPAVRQDERKPPPSAADENRKYFPQQKRF